MPSAPSSAGNRNAPSRTPSYPAPTVQEIDEAIGREAMATGASDDDRVAEVRKRMLAAARKA